MVLSFFFFLNDFQYFSNLPLLRFQQQKLQQTHFLERKLCPAEETNLCTLVWRTTARPPKAAPRTSADRTSSTAFSPTRSGWFLFCAAWGGGRWLGVPGSKGFRNSFLRKGSAFKECFMVFPLEFGQFWGLEMWNELMRPHKVVKHVLNCALP